MAAHNELGRWGEDLAADYLTSQGFVIVERNWRWLHKEIDIIAINTQTRTMSFVEVKTRKNSDFLKPELAVNKKKMLDLCAAANAYVKMRRVNCPLQFDIIAITGTPDTTHTINYIPEAFTAIPNYRQRRRY